jgi:hypothetical protein
MELEKWQQYYQEKFRIRMIEWLRNQSFDFVFEEDVEITKAIVEKVKINMFTPKVPKEILQARKLLSDKAATYYSSEALNPRPKRGRPPKQIAKVETEPQFSQDIYIAVPKAAKPLLFIPDYHSSSVLFTFSDKFGSEADLLAHRKQQLEHGGEIGSLKEKLQVLRALSSGWNKEEGISLKESSFDEDEDEKPRSASGKKASKKTTPKAKAPAVQEKKKVRPIKESPVKKSSSVKSPAPGEKTNSSKSTPKTRLRPLVRKIRKKP